LTTDSEIFTPTAPVEVIVVASNDNGKTLPMISALLLDANVVFSSMAVKLILDSDVFPSTAVGVNISESVVNFTAIDEHMVLVSTTMQISDKGLSLSSEAINITSTGLITTIKHCHCPVLY
jgi:hypothetical protein